MKLPSCLRGITFLVPALLLTAPRAFSDPVITVNGGLSVSYTQTTAGSTTLEAYQTSIGVNGSDSGNFDPNTYFPTSVTFSGSDIFPSGQVDVAIATNFGANVVSGSNYYGAAGSGSWGAPPSAGGYFWANAGAWSPQYSDVAGPLTAAISGGAFDGLLFSVSLDPLLLPTVPLFTGQTLADIGSLNANQALSLSFAQPLLSNFSSSLGVIEFLSDNTSIGVLYTPLDNILNADGYTIAANTFTAGHEYMIYVSQTTPTQQGSYDSYTATNSIRFTVGSAAVPDGGPTATLLLSALSLLALGRRRRLAVRR